MQLPICTAASFALREGDSNSETDMSMRLRHDDSEDALSPSTGISFTEGSSRLVPSLPLAFPSSMSSFAASELQVQPTAPLLRQEHRKSLASTTTVNTVASTTSSYRDAATLAKNNPMQRRNVYISGLPATFRSQDLRDLCKPFGLIEACKLCVSCNTANSAKSYGFVLFCTEESAAACIRAKNGTFLQGRCLQARYADATATPQPLSEAQRPLPPPSQTSRPTSVRARGYADGVAVSVGTASPRLPSMLAVPSNSPTVPLLPQQPPMMVVLGPAPGRETMQPQPPYTLLTTPHTTSPVQPTLSPTPTSSLVPNGGGAGPAWVVQTPTWVYYPQPSVADAAGGAGPVADAMLVTTPTQPGVVPSLNGHVLAPSGSGAGQKCVLVPVLPSGASVPSYPVALYMADSNGVGYNSLGM